MEKKIEELLGLRQCLNEQIQKEILKKIEENLILFKLGKIKEKA